MINALFDKLLLFVDYNCDKKNGKHFCCVVVMNMLSLCVCTGWCRNVECQLIIAFSERLDVVSLAIDVDTKEWDLSFLLISAIPICLIVVSPFSFFRYIS